MVICAFDAAIGPLGGEIWLGAVLRGVRRTCPSSEWTYVPINGGVAGWSATVPCGWAESPWATFAGHRPRTATQTPRVVRLALGASATKRAKRVAEGHYRVRLARGTAWSAGSVFVKASR